MYINLNTISMALLSLCFGCGCVLSASTETIKILNLHAIVHWTFGLPEGNGLGSRKHHVDQAEVAFMIWN